MAVITGPHDFRHMFRPEIMPRDKAMTLVERIDWEALVPKYRFKIDLPVNVIILRYTGSEPCTDSESCSKVLTKLQNDQMVNKGMPDIVHNFMIGGDGMVYEGTGWLNTTNKLETEFQPYDFSNYDIGYIAKNKDDVTPEMRWAVRKLMEHGLRLEYIDMNFIFMGELDEVRRLSD